MRYFGRDMMARNGRDPAQFQFVGNDVDVGEHFWRRLCDVATRLPARDNGYLRRFLLGSDGEYAPPYLRAENYARLRRLCGRVTIVCSTMEQYLRSCAAKGLTFSKANLSDMCEYMSDEATAAFFRLLSQCMRPGARVALWQLLLERRPPPPWRVDESASGALHDGDRVFFYRGFRLCVR